MKLPEIGVKRPIATVMFFIAIILFGLVSLKLLPLDIMPEMEFPSITVITVYPGASANEVEEQVTKPLETVLSAAEHLNEIKSTSKENVSFIQLRYKWGSDITSAANNARDLMELVKSRLPNAARTPVIYKVNSSMMPILVYGVNAKENMDGIESILEEQIASPLRKVDGVGTVIYLGQPEREIRVVVNPEQLSAYNISASYIATMLKADNISVPGGNMKIGIYDFSVRVPGKFSSVEEIENTVLKSFNGHIVLLKDVAKVDDSFVEHDAFARNENGLGVALMVQKQSGVNTLDAIKAVRSTMESVKKGLPDDVKIWEIMSTDEVITESIDNLTSSIWFALIFVTLIVLAFLRNWKSSLIIFITMPVSLITAFAAMYILGYTINIFSLMALVIAIGMVVDNAIVVLENITQHVEKGANPKQAAIFGTSEMGMAIGASTVTTLVVFLPMVFMEGVVGIMFKQLAILTSACLIMSLITALWLTPMLSSKLIKPIDRTGKQRRHNKLFIWSEQIFQSMENGYKRLLGWAVFHKGLTITVAISIFALTMLLGRTLGTDYIPNFDAGDMAVVFETEVGTSAVQTDSIAQKVMRILEEEIPEMVAGSMAAISGQTGDGALTTVGFQEGKNVSTVLCHLALPDNRSRSAEEIGEIIRKRVAEIPQIEKFHVAAGSILSSAILGNRKAIEIYVSGRNFEKMNSVANSLQESMSKIDGLKDVTTTIDRGKLEIQIIIDKEKASQMALNTAMIGLQIRQNLYGTEAGEYGEDGKDYKITVQYAPEYRNKIDKLKEMRVTNLLAQQIPLSSFAEIVEGSGPIQIQRMSQQRFVMISSNIEKISLGDAKKSIQNLISEVDVPQGVDIQIGGQISDQKDSFSNLYLILFLGIALVYMVMAAQFESFKDPFIIIFAIPFTMVGVIWAFFITGLTLSITTFIGIIMLMGIVVNNGIILVDYTNMLRKRCYSLKEAVMEAGRSRLRPVLMTTLTTILGMLPMAMSSGMGREMYSPLGITIIGGLLISTIVTLILIPTVYTAINHKTLKREQVKNREEQE